MIKDRRIWYLLGLLLLFAGLVYVENSRPKPVNRSTTFINKDKIPYGTYALFELLPGLLGGPVESVREPIFNQVVVVETEGEDAADDVPPRPKASYLFIDGSFRVDSLDAQALLDFTARGNDVFIAAETFDYKLADTLAIRTDEDVAYELTDSVSVAPVRSDSVTLRFTNPALLTGRRFRYPTTLSGSYFVADSLTQAATVLATDQRNRPVLLRVPHGKGSFYLCSVPIAFANEFVLRPRTGDFAFGALSYLPTGRQVYWDEYQKQGRAGQQSLLRVLLSHEALRTALYLALLGTALFVLIEARRRQRIIPVITPLPNTTLQFTRTVASLYQQGSNHALIAEKKILLFLEYLRTRFQEPTTDLNDENFRDRVAQKAGVPRERLDQLLRMINLTRTAPQVSDHELLLLSRAISQFRRDAG
ncbi:DUF4350 domain-containing protein [Hymenobacter sp. BT175]|uniref:DUF4350 domain-containing protein n=1 Tax=Hymenobacter translucens TaxID=2886507 RepID=UPI001D0F0D25|nr:DUF4350 domain-containing protein [Hymenobacter translucens]MCC2547070.1 DUF4350 domain-containing protein [Hymenobacter translucens]